MLWLEINSIVVYTISFFREIKVMQYPGQDCKIEDWKQTIRHFRVIVAINPGEKLQPGLPFSHEQRVQLYHA